MELVRSVRVHDDYQLEIQFSNGEVRLFHENGRSLTLTIATPDALHARPKHLIRLRSFGALLRRASHVPEREPGSSICSRSKKRKKTLQTRFYFRVMGISH